MLEKKKKDPRENKTRNTLIEKMMSIEVLLGKLLEVNEVAAEAINRLEVCTFPLIKLLIKKGFFTYEELDAVMHEFPEHENLGSFFGELMSSNNSKEE